MIIILDSVGSVYDTETKMTYAAYNEQGQKLYNRLYDEDSGVHLNDCNEEWIDALSEEDIYKVSWYKTDEERQKEIEEIKGIIIFE